MQNNSVEEWVPKVGELCEGTGIVRGGGFTGEERVVGLYSERSGPDHPILARCPGSVGAFNSGGLRAIVPGTLRPFSAKRIAVTLDPGVTVPCRKCGACITEQQAAEFEVDASGCVLAGAFHANCPQPTSDEPAAPAESAEATAKPPDPYAVHAHKLAALTGEDAKQYAEWQLHQAFQYMVRYKQGLIEYRAPWDWEPPEDFEI